MKYYFSVLFLVMVHVSFAQTPKVIDTSFNSRFDKLPRVESSVDEAWKNYYPKNKITPCKQYGKELKQQLTLLYEQSSHKSRLLSMLAGKYEDESERYDFSKVKIEKDPSLDAALSKANTAYFYEWDNYSRIVNSRSDSAFKQTKGTELAKQLLVIYSQEFPRLMSKIKKHLLELNKVMITKGYNKVLADLNSNHRYYIQLLEVRGLLLDRLYQLNEQVNAANQMVAELLDSCNKNPELCK